MAALRYRVLLVDDDFDSRNILARLLTQHFDVATADGYDAALAAAQAAPPHVVITDIALGDGHDGIKLMSHLQQRYAIKGIAVSGYHQDDEETLRRAGLVKSFLKPLQFDKLLRAIYELCDGHSSQSNLTGLPPADSPQ